MARRDPVSNATAILALWQRPLLGDMEVPAAVGISQASWSGIKKNGGAPPRIVIGGRPFWRTADLCRWIEEMPEAEEH